MAPGGGMNCNPNASSMEPALQRLIIRAKLWRFQPLSSRMDAEIVSGRALRREARCPICGQNCALILGDTAACEGFDNFTHHGPHRKRRLRNDVHRCAAALQ